MRQVRFTARRTPIDSLCRSRFRIASFFWRIPTFFPVFYPTENSWERFELANALNFQHETADRAELSRGRVRRRITESAEKFYVFRFFSCVGVFVSYNCQCRLGGPCSARIPQVLPAARLPRVWRSLHSTGGSNRRRNCFVARASRVGSSLNVTSKSFIRVLSEVSMSHGKSQQPFRSPPRRSRRV